MNTNRWLMLAVATATGSLAQSAMAQSSVTLFGVVDAGVARIAGTGAGHSTGLISGGNTTPRLGFRGVEDLGGGLAASYWLEGDVAVDTGAAAGFSFMRRSTISLSGNFGEIRMGRDFSSTYTNLSAFDPYSQRGLGQTELYGSVAPNLSASGAAFNYVRNSNSVAYFLPETLGGIYGNVQYSFGERNSTAPTTATNSSSQQNYFGGRLGYSNGPVNIGAAYGKYSDISRSAAFVTDYQIANIGASYNFGFLRAMAFFQQDRLDGQGAIPAFRYNTYVLGVTAPVGSGRFRASLGHYDNRSSGVSGGADTNKFGVGYVYQLSKRTAIYADVAQARNKGSAAFTIGGLGGSLGGVGTPTAGGKSTGYVVGMTHVF